MVEVDEQTMDDKVVRQAQDNLMYMDAYFCIEKKSQSLFNWLIFSPCTCICSFSFLSKSVVQLKLFDNIFSDLDDAPNVLSFISCHSHIHCHQLTIATWNKIMNNNQTSSWLCCNSYITEWQARATRGSTLSVSSSFFFFILTITCSFLLLFYAINPGGERIFVLSIINNPQVLFDTFCQ